MECRHTFESNTNLHSKFPPEAVGAEHTGREDELNSLNSTLLLQPNSLRVPEGLEDLSVQVVAAVDQVGVTVSQRVRVRRRGRGLAALKQSFQQGDLHQVQQSEQGLLLPHFVYRWKKNITNQVIMFCSMFLFYRGNIVKHLFI